MIIVQARILAFELPFTQPVRVAGSAISHRRGFLLQLKSDNGHESIGEIAPLIGLHRETQAEALASLKNTAQKIIGLHLPAKADLSLLEKLFYAQVALPPSVRFGLDMALTGLLAACRNRPVASLFKEEVPEVLRINGLASGKNAEAVIDNVHKLLEKGYETVKIKVSGRPVNEDIKIFATLNQFMRYNNYLIPDANRGWSVEQAFRFAETLNPGSVLYLEEPLRDPADLPDFFRKTGINIGLDETLVETQNSSRLPLKGVGAFVLKPDALGSLSRLTTLARLAKSLKIAPVISSSFNTGVCLTFLAELGAALSPEGHAGLDTYSLLEKDVLKEPLPCQGGKWILKKLRCHPVTLNRNNLTLVEEWK